MIQSLNGHTCDLTVLCATDLSEASVPALQWAVGMSKRLHAHLALLYTYRLMATNGKAISKKREIEDEAVTKFHGVEVKFLKDQGITYDFRSEVGFMTDRVQEFVRQTPIALLVVGGNIMKQEEGFIELMKQIQFPFVVIPKTDIVK